MSDERTDAAEPIADDLAAEATPADDMGTDAGDAWRAVLDQLDDLGEAIGRWAKAAVNDPDNKRRAQELKTHIDSMGDKVGAAIDGAVESDAAQSVKDAAGKAGDAIKEFGQKVGDEVFPRMASAFEAAAGKLHEAANKMEDKSPEESSEERYTEADAAKDVTL